MKRWSFGVWFLGSVSLFAALSGVPTESLAKDFQVGVVFDRGGRDDRSFNAAAYRGAMEAQARIKVEPKISVKTVEASDDTAFEGLLRSFANKGYDLVIAIGIAQADALRKVAPSFPQTRFAVVDAEVSGPNIVSLMFEEHEGSYLVGALAAMASKSGKVGFIGGMDIPLVRRFEKGYAAGAKKANPSIQVVSNFIGVTGEAWHNPAKAKELALSQYGAGADVIFAAAGASGSGLFDAAEEKKKLAIGVDSNQNGLKPGFILTSMLKRVDVAVQETIRLAHEGKFAAGTRRFGLGNRGVDFAMDEHNKSLVPAASVKKAEELRAAIVSGKIRVPDYYQERGGKK